MAETLKKRNEVPENLKWDTSRIFKSNEECLEALHECTRLSLDIEKKYKGKLTTGKAINDCLAEYEKFMIQVDYVSSYTSLNVSVDFTDPELQRIDSIATNDDMEA